MSPRRFIIAALTTGALPGAAIGITGYWGGI